MHSQRFQRQVENFLPACLPYAKELTNQARAQFIPRTTNVAHRETISNHTERMVPSFPRGNYCPQATEEKVISIPQGISDQEEEEIITVVEGTPNDILHKPQGFSVTKGVQEKMAYFPQENGVSQQTQDDIICNPQGFSVTKGMQEKMAYFPQGNRVPQQTQDDIICIPQRFNMDQGSQEEGITIPQGTLHQDKCDQQRTLDETTCIPQGIDYPHRIQSEGICNVQGLHSSISNGTQGNFPRGIEEEVISVQQEIISIPGQSPLCKTSYVPQEIINFPQGKQGQDQNMYDLSKGIDCQGPQKWGMPIQGVTTNDVSDHIQPGSTNIVSASL